MKRTSACFLILAAQPVILCLLFHPVLGSQTLGTYGTEGNQRPDGNVVNRGGPVASVPEIELDSENVEETEATDKVTIIGCDNTAWETAALSAGQKELAGTWIGHEQNRTGEWSIAFTYTGRFEMKGPDGEWHHGKYACDAKKGPKILNLYIKESSNSSFIGQTFLMIYKVDSTTLTCASSEAGVKARPGTFALANGIRIFVVTRKN